MASNAGPPSPEKPATPVPATVLTTPPLSFSPGSRGVRIINVAGLCRSQDFPRPGRAKSARARLRRCNNTAPFPATVVTIPSSEIRRTRLFCPSPMNKLPELPATMLGIAENCALRAGTTIAGEADGANRKLPRSGSGLKHLAPPYTPRLRPPYKGRRCRQTPDQPHCHS